MTKNIFEKILDGELPCDKVYEDERILAFKDIHPAAPIHLLIIPKKKGIKSLQDLKKEDFHLMAEIVRVAQKLAKEFGIGDHYRFLTNVGAWSGQTIPHLHFHLIGGHQLGSMA